MTVRLPIRRSRACRTASSDSLSRAEVASSSKRIGTFLRKARAMPKRWRWPSDSFTPGRRYNRCKALRQTFDDRCIGRGYGLEHFRVGSLRSTVSDILHDRAVKQLSATGA